MVSDLGLGFPSLVGTGPLGEELEFFLSLKNFKKKIIFIHVYVCMLHVRELELQLQVVGSLGTERGSSARTASALNPSQLSSPLLSLPGRLCLFPRQSGDS